MGLGGVVSKGGLTLIDDCWAGDQFRGNQPGLGRRADFGGKCGQGSVQSGLIVD